MGFSDILADAVKDIPLAEVLRERLALASDQFVILDREFSKLKIEKAHLESENQKLRLELQERIAQISALEIAAEHKRKGQRTDIQHKILVLMPMLDRPDPSEIASRLGISKDSAEFHLTELKEDELVDFHFNMHSGVTYSLAHEGRRYLAERGLI